MMKTEESNVALQDLFNLNKYEGWLSILTYLNIWSILQSQQFENCGMNQYLAKWDDTVNHWDRLAGMGANGLTQMTVWFIEGQSTTYQPAVVKAWYDGINHINEKQYDKMFGDMELFFSSLVKYEANDRD